MRTNITTMDAPVHLPLPDPEPDGEPGCAVCAALLEQRAVARRRGDLSSVTDCNVELRHHRNAEGHL
ncbi:hypothetical protein [Streptomyces sp. TRM64462]|uniref:hypothetical protein n=1 Tax=Streptomyces sp. TRM64462 TaxID=2741726 RepID=UPI0015862A28|nr:hypothetical protein [Streptomyces sp. TRM64462]